MNLVFLAAEATQKVSFFYEDWFIIKQFIWIFGQVMNFILYALDKVGIHNIALCIVLFTILTKMMLLPLTIKQQKFTRLNSFMAPELQAIQKKYKGKTDQVSQQKMMMEQRALQDKYGTSMSAGCLPTMIQFPILFGLYPVVYNMPKYVSYLQNFTQEQQQVMFTFLGINLNEAPGFKLSITLIFPILVAGSQFLATKFMTPASKNGANDDNPMAASMKSMNIMMPLMLAFFSISMPAFLSIYWIVQSLVMAMQQYFINKHLDKVPIEEIVKANIEKRNKQREKKGLPPISDKAGISTKNIEAYNNAMNGKNEAENSPEKEAEKQEKIRKATEYYQSRSAAPGSLAAKANMVRDYNEKNNK